METSGDPSKVASIPATRSTDEQPGSGANAPQLFALDLTAAPTIYRTNNPQYFMQWCIDFQPETVPTIAGFDTEEQAHRFLIDRYSAERHAEWFPDLSDGRARVTCSGCTRYVLASEVHPLPWGGEERYCLACQARLTLHAAGRARGKSR